MAKYFQADAFWVYSCSCDHDATNLTDSLSHNLSVSYDRYKTSSHRCIHMNAAKIRNLTLNSNGFVPVGSDCAVGVETDGNFGVVCLDAGKIFCSTCVCVCVCACVCVCVCVCVCTCSVYKKLCYGWVQWYLSFDGMEKCMLGSFPTHVLLTTSCGSSCFIS